MVRVPPGEPRGGPAALLSGAAEGRRLAEDRIGFPFSGSGLADATVAALVYERAQALGLGRTLVL